MIRIGDFSKLSHVSVKTLRYYDEVDLLKPLEVDQQTGYRLYAHHQLARLNRILALKDLGFSLNEIKSLLEEDLPHEKLQAMLQMREAEITKQLAVEIERLERVRARLKQIEQENTMSDYEVIIKSVEALQVASMRNIVPTPPKQGQLWQKLDGYLAMHRVRPEGACLTIYHDDEYKETDLDVEVCEPINVPLKESANVKVQTLPAEAQMACTVHHGPFISIDKAYAALFKWISENGYRISGPCREVYIRPAKHGSQTDKNTVTEIQYPVQKT